MPGALRALDLRVLPDVARVQVVAREGGGRMSVKRICKTCGRYVNQVCEYGVTDRYRGIKEPCVWWKRKRRRKVVGE